MKILGRAFPRSILQALEDIFTDRECLEEVGFTQVHKIVLQLQGGRLEDALSQRPALLDAADFESRTPLYWAAQRGDVDSLACLLAHGADPNLPSRSRMSPLCAAASAQSPNCIIPLLDAGADVNAPDLRLHTPLFYACNASDDLAFIRPLVEAGADVNAMTDYQQCPLIAATTQDHAVSAEYLIEQGAEINCRGQNGGTPISFAVEYNAHKVLKLLMDSGADCTIYTDRRGPTIAHTAARHADVETVEILIQNLNCKIDIEDLLGEDHQGFDVEEIVKQRPTSTTGVIFVQAFKRLMDKLCTLSESAVEADDSVELEAGQDWQDATEYQ